MSEGFTGYPVGIVPGHSEINDEIMRVLPDYVEPPYLDVGCNTGWLLTRLAGGVGIDASIRMAEWWVLLPSMRVAWGRAEALPFKAESFRTVVLSCVLEQMSPNSGHIAIAEAKRVLRPGGRVVVLTPIPGKSVWGTLAPDSASLIRNVLRREDVIELGGTIQRSLSIHYLFSIEKSARP